jgi:outer membrane protein
MTSISKIGLACAALLAASGAFAQKAGDNIVSVGLASINTNTDVGPLTNSGAYTPLLVGSTANISSETTVSFGWLHMYTDNIGGEFTLGLPPTVTQDLMTPNGGALGTSHPGAAQIDIWTPTAIAKYFFGTSKDQWRPYVGIGASYVSFHNINTKQTADVKALAGTSAALSSTWAPVYNAGLIYNIDDKWSISGSVSYIPLTTSATFVGDAAHGSTTTTGDIKLKTTDYVVKMGYRF